MRIPLSAPDIGYKEKRCVKEVLDGLVLSLGPRLVEFEEKLAKYVGCRYAVAVNSGTSALQLAVKALRIGAGDEVVTTPFSFIASANCILFERAKPIFIDIEDKTLNIDVNKLEDTFKRQKNKSQKLKAILPVHLFGRPCEMDEILDIAERYELKVIEDACEAIGAEYLTNSKLKSQSLKLKGCKGSEVKVKELEKIKSNEYEEKEKSIKDKTWKKVGSFGECGVFAFYPNKQITTGEGGMIVTDDENIYKLCRSMRNQGRSDNSGWLEHERLGYNFRISDINCALGIAQLGRINEILAKREKVARVYSEKLAEVDELILPQFEKNKRISWFVYVVRLLNKFSREDRDFILNKLKDKGIGYGNYFAPIHLQPFYQKMFGYKKGDFPTTEKAAERTIALPFYNNLKEEEIHFVCKSLKDIFSRIK